MTCWKGWFDSSQPNDSGAVMLHYAVVFLIVALLEAAAGFGGIAGEAA